MAASDYNPGEFGPLSPDQLAKLDRALTPAEQKAVDDWQSRDADVQLSQERAKGGPRSETVTVTSKGAIIKSAAPKNAPPWWEAQIMGLPLWQVLLGAAGASAMGVGIYMVARKK